MSERDRKRYRKIKSDPVKYAEYLDRKRREMKNRPDYERERKRKCMALSWLPSESGRSRYSPAQRNRIVDKKGEWGWRQRRTCQFAGADMKQPCTTMNRHIHVTESRP